MISYKCISLFVFLLAINSLVFMLASCKSNASRASDLVGGVVAESDIYLVSSKHNLKIFQITDKASYSKLTNQKWLGMEKTELSISHGLTWRYPVYVGRSPYATWMVIVGETKENGATLVLSDL